MRGGAVATALACLVAAAGVAACGGGDGSAVDRGAPAPTVVAPTAPTSSTTPSVPTSTTIPPPATTAPPPAPVTTDPAPSAPATTVVDVAYRLERRVADEATADFEAVVEATLADPRGWARAAFRFERRDEAAYLIVLAEGDEVDRLCLPYDTYGKYSCQNGPVVALNADRWRTATPEWTGDLATYRQMLVNHEVGHLLGMKHPRTPQCPRPGEPAPIMNQQSTELNGCLPNPWPLDDEVAAAARHDRKLAPGPGE